MKKINLSEFVYVYVMTEENLNEGQNLIQSLLSNI